MKAFSTYLSTRLNHWCCLVVLALFAVNTALAQPANDECSDAIALVCGDVVTGSNLGADTEDLPQCGMIFPGQTVWYTITGTGGDITASTCSGLTDFDTQLGVFSGSCGDFTCVAGNNNTLDCDNPRFSTVTWASEAGTTYYIVVAGVLGADGDFELSVDCEEVAPDNDLCADAEPIACGDVVIASTETANNEPGLGTCTTSLGVGPGVWYSIVGTGGTISVTTCGAATDFDTKLGVFSGSCGSLVCVGGDDDEFGTCSFSGLQSRVTFGSTVGETYYIYVTGFSTSTGTFELSVECANPLANDDVCDALPLSMGATPFDLTTATAQAGEVSPGPGTGDFSCDSQDGWCSFEVDVDASIWYTFVAPASGCVDILLDGGDSQMAIWSVGDCSDFSTFTEVAANDDGGDDLAAGLEDLLLTPGETYYLQVDDYAGGPTFASGNINFSEGDGCVIPPPPAQTCGEATAIACGDKVEGDTRNGSINPLNCGPGAQNNLGTAPGLWYAFEGNNTLVTLNTCSPVLDFDVHIGVFAGPCEALSCVAISSNLGPQACPFFFGRADEVTFPAFEGTTYYVYVTGVLGAAGNFEMNVTCGAINDECENALPIACGETVSGSTDDASPDVFPACGTVDNGAAGVWYEIVAPADGMLTASTCNQADYDTKLFIFEGACGALACIAGNDDGLGCSGFTSEVSWATTEGITYYILVTGFSSSSAGDFDLTVSGDCGSGGGGGGDCDDADGIIDDVCDADCLELNVPTGFTNDGATVQAGEVDPGPGTTCTSGDGWCDFEPQPFLDNTVWFTFVAPDGGCVDVGAIGADLQIAVYSATDCNDFSTFAEIGGDDDNGTGVTPLLEGLAVTPGETYYVQIDGYNGATAEAGTVTVNECGVSPIIPACEEATEIFCGDVVTGSTDGITPLPLETCITSLSSAGGVWYTFTGLGDNITVSTCGAGTDYDTKIGVFSGDCTLAGLVCVGGNDDDCGLQSSVTFAAMNGTEYYIYVSGFGSNTGTFELSVDCAVALQGGDENGLSEINKTQLNPTEASDAMAIGDFYPNPTAQNTNIQIYAPREAEAQIQLFDAVGRLAHRSEVDLYNGVNTVELQVANLPVGSYFAKIVIGKEVFQKKLVITK